MPIYAYRCEECGHTEDILQKLSDEPLKKCTSCGKESFKKMLTAAGVNTGSSGSVSDFSSPCSACPMGFNGPCG